MTDFDRPTSWQFLFVSPWRDFADARVLEALRIFESYLPRGEKLRWADLTPGAAAYNIRRVWSKQRFLGGIIDKDGWGKCSLTTVRPSPKYEPRAGIWLEINGTDTRQELHFTGWANFDPLLSPAQLRELMARIGTALGADKGEAEMPLPHRDERQNVAPYRHRSGGPRISCSWPPAEGFPRLQGHVLHPKGGPRVGTGIKWINYWSRELCELAGFPPEDRGAYWHAEKLDNGAWVWQLTEDPVDWLRREHRMQYKRALLVLPFIGNRDPRWPKPPPMQSNDYLMEFHLACPPRTPGDDRPLRLCEAVERLYYDDIAAGNSPPFPFEFLYDDELDRVEPRADPNRPMPDRAGWLAQWHDGDIPTLSTAAGLSTQWLQGRHFDHPPPGYLYVRVLLQIGFPRQPTLAERKPDLILETCARVMNAYWGRALPTECRNITDCQVDHGDPRDQHPEYLPILRPPGEMPDVYTPPALGQINYWSTETCRRVGFPPGGDPEVMAYAREVEGGGWLWAVTREMLELKFPVPEVEARHHDIFRRAYERFPAVGRRDQQ